MINEKINKTKEKTDNFFFIKLEDGRVSKVKYYDILDALREAKKVCNSTRKDAIVYKKTKDVITEMSNVKYIYYDYFYELRHEFKNDKQGLYSENSDCDSNDVDSSYIISKEWDDM